MIQHVAIETPPEAVDAQVAFYALLGFERVEPPPLLRDRFTWVERNGTHIHLVPVAHPKVPTEGHTAVVAEDAEAAVATLRRNGFQPRPGTNAWDAPRWFVTDPAGHRVEVMSAPPIPPWPQ